MRDIPLLDAIRQIASEQEWDEFLDWRSRAPRLLPSTHPHPWCPDENALALSNRAIALIRSGQWTAKGFWDADPFEMKDIPVQAWSSRKYFAYYNELRIPGEEKGYFSDICVSARSQSGPQPRKPAVRSAVRDWMRQYPHAHGARLSKQNAFRLLREELAPKFAQHEITERLFNALWKTEFHESCKLPRGRPKGS